MTEDIAVAPEDLMLSQLELAVLMNLARNPAVSLTMASLSGELGVAESDIQTVAFELTGRGLIHRHRDETLQIGKRAIYVVQHLAKNMA